MSADGGAGAGAAPGLPAAGPSRAAPSAAPPEPGAGSGTAPVWVLVDPRAGTAAQALGIAERLGLPFRPVPLAWSPLAGLPLRWPTLLGLDAATRAAFVPPWPRLVLSAGRRAAPAALWLGRRGARTVHCMDPRFGRDRFDLLVIGRHDGPPEGSPGGSPEGSPEGAGAVPNILPILGATHRLSPGRLAAARTEWAAFAALPRPRVALLVGGRVRDDSGLDPAAAAALGRRVAGFAGSVLATTSRRTGAAAAAALAGALAAGGDDGTQPVPHRLFRWGDGGPNPYAGLLAWADAVVVTGESVSMLSEALATAAPVFVADLVGGTRQRALHAALYAAGEARPLEAAPAPFARRPLDESGRVAAAIRARGWIG
ncbi:mitochondrial fission ELM1 family protein [Roseomonas sp. NAR14]|uniref:Mitochondrial fission ELM1 family protein n=1 Tax=Roseomonas acroporae TaxID=2937791 RepID=A0A9X1Y7I2_9PROT|nr:mitochondrial fission ELM1 family protein [Roseomonas acroporae]MCK8784553.1 mitochondrial fission ELM1 family protein [Roseomonas acroporae]